MATRRLPLALLCAALAATLAACGGPANPGQSGATVSAAFRDAAAHEGVPRRLLEAIGWQESHWFMPPHRNIEGGYGLMNLKDGTTLQEAHRLTGLPLEALEHDPTANIRGAAAVLRHVADHYFKEYPSRSPKVLSDWFEVVEHYSGYGNPDLAESYAKGVYQALQMGTQKLFADGVVMKLAPSQVNISGDLMFTTHEDYLTPDYPNAIWRPADPSNYRVGRANSNGDIRTIVIHTVQGTYLGAISWFQNPASNVSAHYVVSKTGEVTQMVQDKDTAWHVRCWNDWAIGIEHEGYISDPNAYTDAMYKASAALGRWLSDKYNIPKYHHAGPEGGPSVAQGFKGHVDLSDCNTHTDPGPYWNWSYYMSLVQGGGGTVSTGTLTGAIFWGTDFNTDKSDPAKRIAGATVTLDNGKSTTTDSSGIYSFTLAPGTYTVTASASGYQTASKSVTVTAGTTTWGSVMLAQDTSSDGTVEGFVFWGNQQSDYNTNLTDPTKRLANATVSFSPGGATATTDSSGYYQLNLAPGTYTVHAAATGYLANDRPNPVNVTTGAVSWGSTMVLAPGGTTDTTPPTVVITAPSDGAVLDLPDVQVVGTVSDQSAIPDLTVNGAAATLTNGGFSVPFSLKPGDNTITVAATDAAGNVGQASVTVTYTGQVTGVDGLVYDVTQGASAVIQGASVTVGTGSQQQQAQTGADGKFSVDTPTGSFPVTVTATGYQPFEGSVSVVPGQRASLQVALTPGGTSSGGQVAISFPADGAVLDQAKVLVTGTDGYATGDKVTVNGVTAKSGTEGAFSVAIALPAGKQAITAVAYDATGAKLGQTVIHVTVKPSGAAGCSCDAATGSPADAVIPMLMLLGLVALRRRAS